MYTLLSNLRGAVRFVLVTRKQGIPDGTIDKKTGSVIPLDPVAKAKRRGKPGPGTEAFEHVINELIGAKVFKPGSLLLTDNESSFLTKRAADDLEAAGVRHETFPTYLGQLLDACDNSFHSVFQHNFQELLCDFQQPTIVEKIQCAKRAYDSVPREAVQNMFRHCGLVGAEPPEKVIQRLVHEGIRPTPRHFPMHLELIEELLLHCGKLTGKLDIARAKFAAWTVFLESLMKK
jgi:hypothetical protein